MVQQPEAACLPVSSKSYNRRVPIGSSRDERRGVCADSSHLNSHKIWWFGASRPHDVVVHRSASTHFNHHGHLIDTRLCVSPRRLGSTHNRCYQTPVRSSDSSESRSGRSLRTYQSFVASSLRSSALNGVRQKKRASVFHTKASLSLSPYMSGSLHRVAFRLSQRCQPIRV